MNPDSPCHIPIGHAAYPPRLNARLGKEAPGVLVARGNLDLLQHPLTALLCSKKCPGNVILRTFDLVRRLRDEGKTVISGFHSPMEEECLRILLRGRSPIILCPARAIEAMRIPKEWRGHLEAGLFLILSPFEQSPTRPTTQSAQKRNGLIAALADRAILPHAEPGGETDRIRLLLEQLGIPIMKPICDS
ncbi:MAG TPA: DNA-processing protein DprA [bacterium]|nr:DNA-processing protein DprA [bacterium]